MSTTPALHLRNLPYRLASKTLKSVVYYHPMTHAPTVTKPTVHKLDDGTLELTVTVAWKDIAASRENVIAKIVDTAELPGFRKGKAPRKMVEEKLDESKIYEEVLKAIIPDVYNAAITELKLKPIINPKIELKEAKENSDWIIRMLTAERPALTLGDYKAAIKEVKAAKHKKIWVPGQEPKPEEQKEQKPSLDELLAAVLTTIQTKIPALLIENQVNRMLSDLVDQTRKLGLSVEQYLSSTGRNADSIRKEYEDQAKKTITLEFALEDIADKEGILVGDDDISTVINSAKSEEEKKALEKERYYLASVLRRQKTLDFLANV